MPAYNRTDLYNQLVQQQASEAFNTSCISEESYSGILKSYPDTLYTPNYFIRVALGALTFVAVLFTAILSFLFFGFDESGAMVTLLIISGVACYCILELMVKAKKYYNAGVDNILMLSSIIFIISTFFMDENKIDYTLIAGLITICCLWLCVRFVDAFMAAVCYLAFFVFVFLLYLKLGTVAKTTAPILMMIASAVVYYILTKVAKNEKLVLYHFCVDTIRFLTLITFYASANYFVVKEVSNEMFSANLSIHDRIPFGWLFWLLTMVIPPAYILYGIIKKEFLFIRTGMVLIAVTIFTIRYYHTFLPAEICMLIGGLLLISISYLLIKYLKTNRHGYTFQNLHPADKKLLNAEALIIAQTFGTTTKAETNTLYGGGTGAGGGATGNF